MRTLKTCRSWARLMLVAFLFAAAGCGALYGNKQDRSRFISAQLVADDTMVFSFSHLVYRPAQGIAAFPDGGIPKYLTDVNSLGTFNLKTGKLRIIRKEKNREWQPGSGHFTIGMVHGPMAVVSQGGQLKGDFKLFDRCWLVNSASGEMTEMKLKEDLASRGRALGEMHLVDDVGTLVFISPSITENEGQRSWRRDDSIIPEIWVRTPQGEYAKVAATPHYERTENGEIIYWMRDTRQFKAYHIKTRQTRDLPGYKVPPYVDVTIGVSVATQGERLEYGRKVQDQWRYEPIPLTPEMLK